MTTKNQGKSGFGPGPTPSPAVYLSRGESCCDRCSASDAVIVVAAAFLINVVYGGVFYVSGLYFHSFLVTFQAGKVTTAWVISLQASLTYFSGIISGPLIARFGTRKVAIMGSLSAAGGIFLSTFATHIIWLYVTYGFFTGVGFGMLMISNGVCVQQHTSRRRALAAGLALCGSGVGCFITPQVVRWAMAEYGWRGSILLLSGIMFNTLPCALLLRAPQIPTPDDSPELIPTVEETKMEIPSDEKNNYAGRLLLTKQLNVLNPSLGSKSSINFRGHTMSSFSIASTAKDKLKSSHSAAGSAAGSMLSLPLVYSSMLSLNKRLHNGSIHGSGVIQISNNHLHLPSTQDLEPEPSEYKPSVFQRLKDMLAPTRTDGTPATLDLVVVLVICSWFCYFGGMPIVYVFCAVKALSIGLGPTQGAVLLSIGGLGEISGRFVGSALASCHERLPLILFVLNSILSGVSCAFVGVCGTYPMMITAIAFFGITMGLSTCVFSTVVRDLVGLNNFPWVVGYAFTFGGIGNIVTIQMMAFIWEKTNMVFIPFLGAGVCLTMCGLFMVGAQLAHLRARSDKTNQDEDFT